MTIKTTHRRGWRVWVIAIVTMKAVVVTGVVADVVLRPARPSTVLAPKGRRWVAQGERYSANPGDASFFFSL